MSYIKSAKDIKNLIENGKRIGEVMQELYDMIEPGISTFEIDKLTEEKIRKAGGIPAFKGYKPSRASRPFPATVCVCINDEVVHGIPSKSRILKDGDIFTVDIGMVWPSVGGVYSDTAFTKAVGLVGPEIEKLLRVTQESLEAGIRACVSSNTVADIGKAVEDHVKANGKYGIIRDLSGHGVGHAVHEEPFVPNYYMKSLEKWKLSPGVVLAIEPMINIGSRHVKTDEDGWTIRTEDGSLSAHFEHTVVITEGDPIVVTRRSGEMIG
jgi:methionyl aminopeptidase